MDQNAIEGAHIRSRGDLLDFTRWMFHSVNGTKFILAPHHYLISAALMRVYAGQTKRLIINIPPRYSKTELVKNFIAWGLGQYPDSEFIYTSYSARLAAKTSFECRELVASKEYAKVFPGVRLRNDSSARDEWRTTAGGIVYASGSGGTITGYGAGKKRSGFGGVFVIDDPHKADEASSDVIRGGVIDWFQNTVETRLNSPETPIIVIMQRLHEMDLAGWLLKGRNGETWTHLCLPAIRANGSALWPAMHTIERLRVMQEASPYNFAGQYMQRPAPLEGSIIKPDKMPVLDAVPAGTRCVRAWDIAATVPKPGRDPDWTVGAKMGQMPDGRWIICDIVRFRGDPAEVEAALRNTAERDGIECTISVPQDPGSAGVINVANFAKILAGFTVKFSPETGDKIERGKPMASQANVGNLCLLRAPWNDALISELRVIPNGSHDDQWDACSRAFAEFVTPDSALDAFLDGRAHV